MYRVTCCYREEGGVRIHWLSLFNWTGQLCCLLSQVVSGTLRRPIWDGGVVCLPLDVVTGGIAFVPYRPSLRSQAVPPLFVFRRDTSAAARHGRRLGHCAQQAVKQLEVVAGLARMQIARHLILLLLCQSRGLPPVVALRDGVALQTAA